MPNATIPSNQSDAPVSFGMRDRRPSTNSSVAPASVAPFTVENDAVPPNQTPILNRTAQIDSASFVLHPPAIAHVSFDKATPFTLQPSIPSDFNGDATPGTLTPTHTAGFAGQEPLVPRRKAERYKFRLVAALVSFFSCGWADGSTCMDLIQNVLSYLHVSVSQRLERSSLI